MKKPRLLSLIPALVLALVCGGYLIIARRNFDKPNFRLFTFEDMVNTVASQTQSPNAVLPNGQTDQPPVPHTIPHNKKILWYLEALDKGPTAFDNMKDPFKRSYAAMKRGRFVFETFCLPCHGKNGTGNGQVAKAFPPFQFSAATAAEKLSEGQIFSIITYGKPPMPSYAAQISPDDRWKVALYIKDLAHYQEQKDAIEDAKEKAAAEATPSAQSGKNSGGDSF